MLGRWSTKVILGTIRAWMTGLACVMLISGWQEPGWVKPFILRLVILGGPHLFSLHLTDFRGSRVPLMEYWWLIVYLGMFGKFKIPRVETRNVLLPYCQELIAPPVRNGHRCAGSYQVWWASTWCELSCIRSPYGLPCGLLYRCSGKLGCFYIWDRKWAARVGEALHDYGGAYPRGCRFIDSAYHRHRLLRGLDGKRCISYNSCHLVSTFTFLRCLRLGDCRGYSVIASNVKSW